jgi:ribulose-5-phosphate 4-epimerase/fuculose-1-phosphate aldolase
MALKTLALDPYASMPEYILDRHYLRKHGKNAYYGQK